jgi:hypothetical protein
MVIKFNHQILCFINNILIDGSYGPVFVRLGKDLIFAYNNILLTKSFSLARLWYLVQQKQHRRWLYCHVKFEK